MNKNNEGLPPEIEKLSERLAKDPKSLVFASLANAYRKNNMIDEAIEILQKGLEIHPNYASARTVLGRCYIDKRMYEMAKVEFKKALESDPQNIVVLEKLGEVYKTLNQYEDAFKVFQKLNELDPLNDDFQRELESLKRLSGNISPDTEQYATFQTIPEQKQPEPKESEDKPEIEKPDTTTEGSLNPSDKQDEINLSTSTLSLSEIFEEEKPPEVEITKKEQQPQPEEKPQDETAAASSSEIFEGHPKIEEKTPEDKTEISFESELQKEQVSKQEEIQKDEKQNDSNPLKSSESQFDEGLVSELTKELQGQESIVETKGTEEDKTIPEEKQKESKPKATETLAEIYLSQGFIAEALNIYEELLEKDPQNEHIRTKIEELKNRTSTENTESQQTTDKKDSAPSAESSQPPETEKKKHQEAQNLDNFQDWLKKFQK
ncbi:MAG: hypothetical protein B5M53_00280 [Candidatus Cloacimonas sp. 4484_209]|nr:MAG: hypothetical protein B5M53_00280 [Candidatus Cloacimonas sp. 4484_209]